MGGWVDGFLYTWVKKGTARVKCLAKNTIQCLRPDLELGLLDPESSELNIRPSHVMRSSN